MQQSVERSSALLGGALPAPPPPESALEGSSDDDIEEFDVDDRASGTGDAGVMKAKDDPAFEKSVADGGVSGCTRDVLILGGDDVLVAAAAAAVGTLKCESWGCLTA